MQHIATFKPEIAALPFKLKSASSIGIQQQIEFKSFLTQADPVYSQPVQPNPIHVDKHAHTSGSNTSSAETQRQPQIAKELSQARDAQNKAPHSDKQVQTQTREKQPRQPLSADKPFEKNEQGSAYDEAKTSQHNDTLEQTDKTDNTDETIAERTNYEKTNAQSAKQQSENVTDSKQKISDSQGETAEDELLLDSSSLDSNQVDWLDLVEKSQGANIENGENKVQMLPMGDIYLSQFIQESDGQNSEALIAKSSTEIDLSVEGELLVVEELDPTININIELTESEGGPSHPVLDVKDIKSVISELAALLESNAEQKLEFSENQEPIAQLLTQLMSATQQENEPVSLGDLEAIIAQLEAEGLSAESLLDAQLLIAQQNASLIEAAPQKVASEKVTIGNAELGQEVDSNVKLNDLAAPTIDNNALQLDEVVKTQQAATNEDTSEAVKVETALLTLLKLSPEKLEKSLDNLAQRLNVSAAQPAKQGNEDSVASESLKSDFVSAMKAGLEEIKAQMKQGHQPAIDLSTLVSDVVSKTATSQISPDTINQTLSRFSQTLEMASSMNAKLDAATLVSGLEKSVAKDNLAQSQVTQSKQAQQQMAQFDKAVNITRSEGQQQLAEKVRWMVNQNNLQADIRLDPPELGSMKVRVNLSGESASVNIVVQSQQAREVLEQATPKLKELLEQQGIELGQSSVQQEQDGAAQQESGSFAGGSGQDSESNAEENVVAEHKIRNGRIGGIDYFV